MTIMIRMLAFSLSFNQCWVQEYIPEVCSFRLTTFAKFLSGILLHHVWHVQLHFKYSTCLCSCFGDYTIVILIYTTRWYYRQITNFYLLTKKFSYETLNKNDRHV